MPSIGRPETENPFAGIQRGPQRGSRGDSQGEENVGETLNRIAGRVPESRFKSYEEHTQLDKDGFLKLLSHQLQNQNPMDPMDQQEFAGELAQFTQLEQMTQMNSNIEKLSQNQGQEEKFYGASFLGKEVFTEGSSINYDGQGAGAMVPFYLERPAERMIVRLYDDRGQLVSQLERENVSEGANNINWDGISNDGTRATGGEYRVEVIAWDHNNETFHGETQSSGLVSGVQFEQGETVLVLEDGRRVFLRDVGSFQLPNDAAKAQQKIEQGLNQMDHSAEVDENGTNRGPAANLSGLPKHVQEAYDKYKAQQSGEASF